MKKIREIWNGWKNLFFKKPDVETIAKEREEVCNGCEMKMEQIGIQVCGGCGCPLMAKIRSLESQCPMGKWNR